MSSDPPTAPGVVTKASGHSVADTLARLEATIRARGLTVFAHIDHRAGAVAASLDMQAAHVLVFGSPQAGTPLMIAAPLVALDLPLRALVWQDPHDQVWVSYQDAGYLAQRYAFPADLIKNIAGIAGIVDTAI